MSAPATASASALWAGIAVGALAAVLYAPAVSSMPQRLRIPRLEPHTVAAPAQWGAFSHRGHGQMSCYSCHPSFFPQRLVGFRHQDMARGKYCGACHNGTRASAIDTMGCETCHEKD